LLKKTINKKLRDLIPPVFIFFGIGLSLWMWGYLWINGLNTNDGYRGIPSFGQDCAIAVSPWTSSDDFASVKNRVLDFKAMAMPPRNC
jgi:hypothetical protein